MTSLHSSCVQDIPNSIVKLTREVYADFLALDYFEKYGGMCVVMAHLVQKIFSDRGYSAQVELCYLTVICREKELVTGYKKIDEENHIDVHAACVVDNFVLLDFGLGSVKDFIGQDFFNSLVVHFHPNPPYIARYFDQKYCVLWAVDSHMKDKILHPNIKEKIQKNQDASDEIFNEYKKYKEKCNLAGTDIHSVAH